MITTYKGALFSRTFKSFREFEREDRGTIEYLLSHVGQWQRILFKLIVNPKTYDLYLCALYEYQPHICFVWILTTCMLDFEV